MRLALAHLAAVLRLATESILMTSPHTDHTVLDWASRALNEAVMGFLAIVALGTAIGPLVFEVSPGTDRLLSVVEVLILTLFIADFVVQFAVASDRSAWLRSPWRIVDAVCIVGPLLSFLPQVSDTVRGALVFRFLRVGRAVAFGARAGAVAVQRRAGSATAVHRGPAVVTVVKPRGESSPKPASWAELLGSRSLHEPSWYHVANVDRARFSELASTAGLLEGDWVHMHELEGGTFVKTSLAPPPCSYGLPASRRVASLRCRRTGCSFTSRMPGFLARAPFKLTWRARSRLQLRCSLPR